LGVFAEFERAMIQERVRAGLKRARSEGKRLGWPLEKAIKAALTKPGRTEGGRKIAERFGVNPGTVQRISRPFGADAAASSAAGMRLTVSSGSAQRSHRLEHLGIARQTEPK